MLTLIADAGSTKIEWVVVKDGKTINHLITNGFNPNYADNINFINILYKALDQLPAVDAVYYYGSGCGSETVQNEMRQYLKVRFEEAKEVYVTHDLMGAARAVLGREQGIACILGTGANSCVYDGENITKRAVSLGYLVGDEGSGCYLGRKLTRAYFYGLMPPQLKLEFEHDYNLNISTFIDNVYHQKEASKYLAGFTKFAGEHQEDPFIQQLVKGCFREFIEVFVLRYPECQSSPIGFVGSVAYHFQGLMKECLEEKGLSLGRVMPSPMEGLIRYHCTD